MSSSSVVAKNGTTAVTLTDTQQTWETLQQMQLVQ